MVDIVVNHFAWAGNHSSVQYDRLIPFSNSSYYHTYCAVTPTSSQTDCWLGDDIVTLPDLATEHLDVQSIFNTWISTLVAEYNSKWLIIAYIIKSLLTRPVDGLRLDSAGNVNPSFFTSFCQAANDTFCLGEVDSGVPAYVCPYQEAMGSTLNYPMYEETMPLNVQGESAYCVIATIHWLERSQAHQEVWMI